MDKVRLSHIHRQKVNTHFAQIYYRCKGTEQTVKEFQFGV